MTRYITRTAQDVADEVESIETAIAQEVCPIRQVTLWVQRSNLLDILDNIAEVVL